MHTAGYDAGQTRQERTQAFREKMQQAGLASEVIALFSAYLEQLFASHEVGLIPEQSIHPLGAGDISHLNDIQAEDVQTGRSLMDRSVLVKLNGGLGTSMGMPFAKSLLHVRTDRTFLDVIVQQAGLCAGRLSPLSLVLMNSFNTRQDTRAYLKKIGCAAEDNIFMFEQNQYPKVLQDSMMPASCPEKPELEWNPPGHGDFFAALHTSGMLQQLLDQGKHYAFVSNADNLGAVLDPGLLGYFVRQGFPFLMEVAWRGVSDKKGGHIAKRDNGQLILREVAQCPEEDLPAFQDISTHCYFNTNNIWVNLQALQKRIEQDGLPRLPLIVNPKTLNPRDSQTPKVYQLETAIGAAIGIFENSAAILVDRDRFLPVKKTDDLLLVRSDCYVFGPDYQLKPNPAGKPESVKVELDDRFYKLVDDFEARFPSGPPSLVECRSLTVKGDVRFGANVVCTGDVLLENTSGHQVQVKDNEVLTGHCVFEGDRI
jgi:UTP--glucose-1-phosphate uridylyltransferase